MKLDVKIMRRFGEMVGRVYASVGARGPKGAEFEEAARLYNDFLGLVPNPAETPADVVDAMISVVEGRFVARVNEPIARPGAGNRSAR